MMNYIWALLVLLSFFCAAARGEMSGLTAAVSESASNAVTLLLKIGGMLCLWGGIIEIASQSRLTQQISRLLSPLLRLLFPGIDRESGAMEYISMNITANVCGLGNAATPLGLEAMKRLQQSNPSKERATPEMILFVVMNSASLHLVPATTAMLRQQAGSANPMEILPASFLTSACALAAGIAAAKIGNVFVRRRRNA